MIADNPQGFGMLRERLSVVTQAWFAQREFTDVEILKRFQESLAEEKVRGLLQGEPEHHQYLGMSLRELIHEFRWQTLVLLKCCLLQPKVRERAAFLLQSPNELMNLGRCSSLARDATGYAWFSFP